METEAFKNEQMTYAKLMYAVMDELKRAHAKFPNQTLEWGGGPGRFWMITGPLGSASQIQKAVVDAMLRNGTATWFDVIAEELLEAGAESGRSKHPDDSPAQAHARLRGELIQVAAMCLRAVADLDSQREAAIQPKEWLATVRMGEGYRLNQDGFVERVEPLLPQGGKHSGACQCKGCAEPDPSETNFQDIDLPPNAGSAE